MLGQDLRANFRSIYAKYGKLGKGNVRLTQSSLILIQAISAAKSAYTFEVLDNQVANINPLEIRLNQNDEFIGYELGVYLLANGVNEAGVPYRYKYLSYVPLELTDDVSDLLPLYDGSFKLGVNNIIYIEKWDLRRHEMVPQTQWKTFDVGTETATIPQIEMSKDVMYPVQPMVTISGAKKNELTISLPHALKSATFDFFGQNNVKQTVEVKNIALVIRGMLAQNAAQFQTSSDK